MLREKVLHVYKKKMMLHKKNYFMLKKVINFLRNGAPYYNIFNNLVKVIHVKIKYSFAAKSLVISPSGNPP